MRAACDELGPGQAVGEQPAHHERQRQGQGLFGETSGLGELTPEALGIMLFEPADHGRVKALHAGRAGVARQHGPGGLAKRRGVRAVFELHDQGLPAIENLQHLRKEGDALLRFEKGDLLQLGIGEITDGFLHPAGPEHAVVMKNHDLLILGQLHIQLRPVAMLHCPTESGQGVFRHGLIQLIEPPMGIGPALKGRPGGLACPARGDEKQPQGTQRRRYPYPTHCCLPKTAVTLLRVTGRSNRPPPRPHPPNWGPAPPAAEGPAGCFA